MLGGDIVGLAADIQLAMLPGMTHVTLVKLTAWLLSMITSFLDASIPEAR